jgi:hypothetical protein
MSFAAPAIVVVAGSVALDAAHGAVGRGADAPRVVVARPRALQELRPFEEERALLREEHLVRGQVDDRRVGLDLPEVGVEGGLERQRGREVELEVAAVAPLGIVVAVERVVRGRQVRAHALPGDVGGHREPAPRPHAFDPLELAEAARPARLLGGHHHPERVEPHRRAHPLDVEAPGLGFAAAVEAQRGKRDAHLGAPAALADRGARLPHRVVAEIAVLEVVRRLVVVQPRAPRGHSEVVGGLAIAQGVERHHQAVGIRRIVALAARGAQGRGVLQVHARADVERLVVVDESHLGPLVRGEATLGALLLEVVDEGGGLPDAVVEVAVQSRRLVDAQRAQPLAAPFGTDPGLLLGGGVAGLVRRPRHLERESRGRGDGAAGSLPSWPRARAPLPATSARAATSQGGSRRRRSGRGFMKRVLRSASRGPKAASGVPAATPGRARSPSQSCA